MNDFQVEKTDDSLISVKVFPAECGLDVPKIGIYGWKDGTEDNQVKENCTLASINKNVTCVEVIESRNCSSSNGSDCFKQQNCTKQLVETCVNRTEVVKGNCTEQPAKDNNTSSLSQCQNETIVVHECETKNVTTCETIIKSKLNNCSESSSGKNCTFQIIKIICEELYANQTACIDHQNKTDIVDSGSTINTTSSASTVSNETSVDEHTRSVTYEDPLDSNSIVSVSYVEQPSAAVSGHFVLNYTTSEGESFYTKSKFYPSNTMTFLSMLCVMRGYT